MPRKLLIYFVLPFWLSLLIVSSLILVSRQQSNATYWIAYTELVHGRSDIFIRSIDDGTRVRLTNDVAEESRLSWSPDGQWIAFLRESDGNWSVHVAQIGSTKTQQMWACEGIGCYKPSISWSGNSQYLEVQEDVIRVQDGTRLFADMNKHDLTRVDWSPNGEWRTLLYGDSALVDGKLYIQNLAQQTQTRLVDLTVVSDWLEWSSDSQWVYLLALTTDDVNVVDIFRVRPDGSDLQNITNMGIDRFAEPRFVQDGEWILFEAWYDDPCCAEVQRHGFRVRFDGGLVENRGPTSRFFTYINTSPNGEWTVMEQSSAYGPLRYTYNRTTSQHYDLGGYGGLVSRSIWSPNGRFIAFEFGGYYLLDVETGEVSVVPFGLYGAITHWSPDGRWLIGLGDDFTVIQVRVDFQEFSTIFAYDPSIRDSSAFELSPELAIGTPLSKDVWAYLKSHSLVLIALITLPFYVSVTYCLGFGKKFL